MFFFLSKTVNFLIMPLVIVSGLLVASLLLKDSKRKKITLRSAILLLLFFSNDFLSNEVAKAWEIPVTPLAQMEKKYEWGIILTGVTRSNTGPEDRVYFSRGADRVIHTLQLYKAGIVKKILVSGGTGIILGQRRREADEIFDVLVMMGVPQENIVVENESRNTHESALLVAKLLEGKATPGQCLLITSAFHMRRARACFQKQGWSMDTFSVDFISHYRKFTPDVILLPKLEAIASWHILLKEWTGMMMYKAVGYI